MTCKHDIEAEVNTMVEDWEKIVAEDGIEATKHDFRSRIVFLRSRGVPTTPVYPDGTEIYFTVKGNIL